MKIPGRWFCLILSLTVLPLGSAQNDVRPTSDAGKTTGVLKTERQRWTALTNARRLSQKADKYEKQGKPEEAERMAEQALTHEEQARGAWHIDVAHRLDQVADLYTLHKKERDAEPLYQRARAIRERALSTHPDVYEQDGGELRVKRNQPAEKIGTADHPPSPGPNHRSYESASVACT